MSKISITILYSLFQGLLIMPLFSFSSADNKSIRQPAVADQFYNGNEKELRKQVEQFVSTGTRLKKHPKIIISPHAGYVFSGSLAGIGFATIDKNVNKVILIGPSHHKYFTGLSIFDGSAYKTPLGNVMLNSKDIQKLRSNPMVHAYHDAHSEEHCLEVQLPFLQVILSDFTIIPMITGKTDNIEAVADLIFPFIDSKTLVVISSDLSHFQSNSEAKQTDARSIETILKNDPNGFINGCGEIPIRIAMYLSRKLNLIPHLLEAKNSFETAPQYGESSRVVGYTSIVYIPDNENGQSQAEFTEKNKIFLLGLAREALNRSVKGEKRPSPENIPDIAKELRGCFVTITKNGHLRGCIGYIEGIKPLYEAIIDNAKSCALRDPRFSKVTPDELDDIKVEVSVLTKPESFSYSSTNDLLDKIVAFRDGIILKKGFNQSTFLPQVWEQLPDKIKFLEHLALKAGLGKNDWKSAEYKKYQAIHFEEN
ncbi:MAG: AmmeMemoRadiSam system protein B [Chitinispirillia bacterium]|jgi:hypothetical protein